MTDYYVLVCINRRYGVDQPSCAARGGEEILAALRAAAAERGGKVRVESCCCFGHCPDGAVVRIAPGGPFHHGVVLADVPALLDEAEAFAAQ
jgi:NADH:ubiquinone oxidoreductase subunit E